MDVNDELKFLGGGGFGGRSFFIRVRVDVNDELKFL